MLGEDERTWGPPSPEFKFQSKLDKKTEERHERKEKRDAKIKELSESTSLRA